MDFPHLHEFLWMIFDNFMVYALLTPWILLIIDIFHGFSAILENFMDYPDLNESHLVKAGFSYIFYKFF